MKKTLEAVTMERRLLAERLKKHAEKGKQIQLSEPTSDSDDKSTKPPRRARPIALPANLATIKPAHS